MTTRTPLASMNKSRDAARAARIRRGRRRFCLALAVRAGFEDRLLRRELTGYEEFTRQTRYRLLTGVW